MSIWPFKLDTVRECMYGDKVFSKEECEKIISYGTNLQKATVVKKDEFEGLDTKMRDSEVFWISISKDTEWLFGRLSQVIQHVNAESFNFDLFGMVEDLQLTKYEAPNGFYSKHVDRIFGQVTRKISVTVQLSDPSDYEGGNLLLHLSDKPIVMQKGIGSVTIFPSYILHEVTPVTKGTRYSLVVWVAGPNFK